ncbi:hypothetical protein BKA66DRAFT_9674 [Pyrenochaeta sp. MPI-SDFR-AT-0127]|nr:hypothetical protein BKA66DRAFT_9674 [Pyrenochaeta sp. MPI-SDFR-AT-0127]
MGLDTLNDLLLSCEEHYSYPKNLIGRNVSVQRINTYMEKLRGEEGRLFDGQQARVNVLDVRGNEGYTRSIMLSLSDVKLHLRTVFDNSNAKDGPSSRFFFINASHSWAPLPISRDMLTFIFTYYQVPPSFLDFMFSFGKRITAEYHDFSALRKENRLFERQRGPIIRQLNRSGHDIRICYNLRSVEHSPKQLPLGWSIRQTAIYHSFDLETGDALWINVKGNQLLENRILEAEASLSKPLADYLFDSLSASLATHMVFVEWTAENWRWYINDLEVQVQKLTRRTIAAPIPHVHIPCIHSRSSTLIARELLRKLPPFDKSLDLVQPAKFSPEKDHNTSNSIPKRTQPPELPPGMDKTSSAGLSGLTESDSGRSLDVFSFEDIQTLQHIEEMIEETIMVLSFNITTLVELRELYRFALDHANFPEDLRSSVMEELQMFEAQVIETEKALETQTLRSRNLFSKLQERKSLLNSILQYRSTMASEFFAEKAQQSSDSMETITVRMHEIAVKTKQETVSMRIITLVTLFFLPGTFVATFMSTDILHWMDSERIFEPQALITYFAISLPLMAITFLTWYAFHRLSRYREYRVKDNATFALI